jgi:uncharacterized lipoprotein YehR (DUF1307 family)
MKRVYALFMSLVLVLGLSACGSEETIVFPFAAADVETIESYYDDGGAEIQKKTITEESDIDSLYTYFSELPVKNKHSSDDGSTLKFVFNLADGTTYELTYISVAVKTGRLQSETADFDYFTSSDVVGVWAGLSGEIEQISSESVS